MGRLKIRHSVNEILRNYAGHIGYEDPLFAASTPLWKTALELGLREPSKMGMTRVLVTCDENNVASRKITEANGVYLENAVRINELNARKLRYWLDTRPRKG